MAGKTFYDAMTAFAGAATPVVSQADRELREKAASDLLYMQADYRQAENEFLMDLQDSNEYDPGFYRKKLNEFQNGWRSKLLREAKTGYTEREADKMLASMQPQLIANVERQARAKEKQHYYLQGLDTIEKNDSTLAGIERADANNDAIENMYRSGVIDEAKKKELISKNYAGVFLDSETNRINSLIEDGIKRGKSFEWISNRYDDALKEGNVFTDYSGADIENFTAKEMKSISGQVKKNALASYKDKVELLQKESDRQLATILDKIHNTADPDVQEALKAQGRIAMKALQDNNPLNMSTEQDVTWGNRFAAHKVKEGGSGSGGVDKAKTYLMKCWNEDFVPAIQNGTAGQYGGTSNAYGTKNYFIDNYVKAYAKEAGLNNEEYATLTRYLNVETTAKLKKDFSKAPQVAEMYGQIENFCKKEFPKDSVAAKRAMEEISDLLTDTIADKVDFSNPRTMTGILNRTTNQWKAVQGNYWEGLNKGKGETSEFVAEYFEKDGVTAKNPEKMLAKFNYALSGGYVPKEMRDDAKIAYTNAMGAIQISPYAAGAKDAMAPYANDLIKAVTKNDTDLTASWESDGRYDLTGDVVFTRGSEKYKIKSPNGRSIEVYKVNGDGSQELIADKKTCSDYFFKKHDDKAMQDKADRQSRMIDKQQANEAVNIENNLNKERTQAHSVMEQNGLDPTNVKDQVEWYGMPEQWYEDAKRTWDKWDKKQRKEYGSLDNYIEVIRENYKKLK